MQKWYLAFTSCTDKCGDKKVGKKFSARPNFFVTAGGRLQEDEVILMRVCLALSHFWTFTVLAVDVRKWETVERLGSVYSLAACGHMLRSSASLELWQSMERNNALKLVKRKFFCKTAKKNSQVRVKPWMANRTVHYYTEIRLHPYDVVVCNVSHTSNSLTINTTSFDISR